MQWKHAPAILWKILWSDSISGSNLRSQILFSLKCNCDIWWSCIHFELFLLLHPPFFFTSRTGKHTLRGQSVDQIDHRVLKFDASDSQSTGCSLSLRNKLKFSGVTATTKTKMFKLWKMFTFSESESGGVKTWAEQENMFSCCWKTEWSVFRKMIDDKVKEKQGKGSYWSHWRGFVSGTVCCFYLTNDSWIIKAVVTPISQSQRIKHLTDCLVYFRYISLMTDIGLVFISVIFWKFSKIGKKKEMWMCGVSPSSVWSKYTALVLLENGSTDNVPMHGCNKTHRKLRLQTGNKTSSHHGDVHLGKMRTWMKACRWCIKLSEL